MEYIEGLTLSELVESSGPQPASRVIAILTQICGSLAEAHAAGLVHRDMKSPTSCSANAVVSLTWSRSSTSAWSSCVAAPDNMLDSKNGLIVGTVGYMAPEAIVEPVAVDARSDIYALGAVRSL